MDRRRGEACWRRTSGADARTGRVRLSCGIFLLTSVLAASVALTLPAAGSARLIEAPRDGATKDGSAKVVVNVGRGSVYARLNGQPIKRHFLRTAPRQRTVRVGAAEGLKRGRNVLRVRREAPRASKRERVVFRVKGNGRLAGIAAHGQHVAGAPIQLRALGKRRRTWCLLAAPRKSELEASRCARPRSRGPIGTAGVYAAKAGDMGLDDLHARRTTFSPDAPGYYRVRLTTGRGPGATSDVYTVAAGPPAPLVSLDIPSSNPSGNGAITVGGASYPPDSYMDHNVMLQIVVLDRRTLTLRWNKSYNCDDAPNTPCDASVASSVTSDLAPLDDDSLVLVSELDYPCLAPVPGAEACDVGETIGPATLNALAAIGLDPAASFPAPDPGAGGGPAFALVGIPGISPGSAWMLRDYAKGDLAETTDLTGALSRDQNGNFLPAPTDYLPLTVRSNSTGASNTMEIGQQSVTAGLPPAATGGFQVVVLDGLTGAVDANEVVVSNPDSASNIEQALGSLKAAIDPGAPGAILVASLGSPTGQPSGGMTQQGVAAWNDLAGFIEKNGGTVHGLLSMKAGEDYAMAARTGSGPAGGTEIGPAGVTPAHSSNWTPSGALSGELARSGDDWRFSPKVGAGDVIDPSQSIMEMLYQAPTPFPEYDEASMNYIYGQVFAPGAPCACPGDVREAYWTQDSTQPLVNLNSTWTTWSVSLTALQPPPSASPAEAAAFAVAKKGVLQELIYLQKATSYLIALGAPLTADADSSPVVEAIVNDIEGGIQQLPPSSPVGLSWLKYVSDALDLGSVIALDPELASVGGAMTKLATGISGAEGLATLAQSGPSGGASGGGDDTLQTTAGNLGTALSGQLSQAATGYSNMVPILASDYGKLKAFGQLGVCSDVTSTCPAGWLPSTADRTRAVGLWVARQAWENLLPAAVGTVAWEGAYPAGQVPDATNWHCWRRTATYRYTQDGDDLQPFATLPAGAEASLVTAVGPNGPLYDLWALSSWNRSGLFQSPVLPDAQQTNELFLQIDPAPTKANDPNYGLGLVPAHFLTADSNGPYLALNGNTSDDWLGHRTGYCQFGSIPEPAPPR